MIVAIDGPAGAGKSTVARMLAERLGFRYLDTGAMYRALTWLALEQGRSLEDGPALGALAREYPITFGESDRVLIDAADVTAAIRDSRIDKVVSSVARHPEVREVMRERQRELGSIGDVVIEGRDIGTVVAPGAEVKVFLNADESERARRRIAERPGLAADALATDLRLRDERDAAQMQAAPDAERIDTTDLTIGDVVQRIEELVRAFVPLRVYGREHVPSEGGLVLAFNHFHWIDPPVFGQSSPRTIYFLAKVEAHRVPGLGQLIRAFGTISVRRGESDREAVRLMRETVRAGHALGLFAEGTRQRSGVPGKVQPGAAMAALQEDVPVVPAAIHGTQSWKPGNWHPVSVVWGSPMRFDGLPKSGKGYREASAEIEREIHRLWGWLVELHEAGRPRAVELP